MYRPDIDPISPALVLVDPELAALVRATAVIGPAYEMQVPATPSAVIAPRQPVSPTYGDRALPAGEPCRSAVPRSTFRRAARRAVDRVGLVGGVAAVGLLVGAAFLPPRQAPHLGGDPLAATTRMTLTWPTRPVTEYRVQVLKGRHLVSEASTRVNHLDVPQQLGPGRYSWRVTVVDEAAGGRAGARWFERGWFIVPGPG